MAPSPAIPRISAGPVELSRIAYGTWRLNADPDRDRPRGYRQKIEALIACGVTTFDLADLYGDYSSEGFFGSAVSRDRSLRQRIELVTKCGIKQPGASFPDYRVRHYDNSYEHITASAEASLRKLSTDYLDLLLIHRPDLLMDADAAARALDELVATGKVRAVGVSNFTPTQVSMLQSRLSSPLAVHELEVSVATPDALHDGRLDQCQQHHLRPLVYSPLGGQVMFDESSAADVRTIAVALAQQFGVAPEVVALAWVLALPTRPAVILGSHRLDRLVEQMWALELSLDRQDWYAIWRAATGRL